MKMGSRNELRGFLKQSQSSETSGTNNEIRVRTRQSSSYSRKEQDEELVKYMTKLPSYLQGMEKGGDNVLNVGVLDWGRLEKWKHGRGREERHGERLRKSERKVSNSGASFTSEVVINESNRCKIDDDKLHTCSNPDKGTSSRDLEYGKSKGSRDLEHSVCGVRCSLELELASRDSLSKQEIATCSYKSSGVKLEKRRRSRSYRETSSGLSTEMGNSGGSLVVRDKHTQKRAQEESESSLGLRSRVPRSCPLSMDLERESEDIMLPLGVDKKEHFGTRRHSKTASRIFDQELREDESRKSRQPSLSKRFSLSFNRLSKSFSSKEDSTNQLFTTSSEDNTDSTRFDSSSNSEKQNGSRVSPLRRLLDPLLKSKNVQPFQDEKKRTRALFQLTVRNGIPLCQFVVDEDENSRIILGGTMKNSGFHKDDSVQYCTFYSVNEVKKKKSRNWLIHGHKEKQLGFVYNVIGQMEMTSNTLGSDITEEKHRNIKESVLFEETEEVKGRKEIAAVVIKKKSVEEYHTTSLEETTVIVPGGVHSFPEKGAPSPLISRWRSGGLCDCGGWDVGCKLHVLSNKTFLQEFDKTFKLFDQEGNGQDSGPVLAMKEVKTGIYRVEFGSFLSALQAFFVCVTVITCGAEEEDRVAKTTGISSSPFAPPLSPVGRV